MARTNQFHEQHTNCGKKLESCMYCVTIYMLREKKSIDINISVLELLCRTKLAFYVPPAQFYCSHEHLNACSHKNQNNFFRAN